jgi:hypothetical protein
MTVDWTHELSGQFDLQWNLAHGPSLETLTDEEYLWEPVPGCWSIRPTGPGGRGEIEQAWPDPEPVPVRQGRRSTPLRACEAHLFMAAKTFDQMAGDLKA